MLVGRTCPQVDAAAYRGIGLADDVERRGRCDPLIAQDVDLLPFLPGVGGRDRCLGPTFGTRPLDGLAVFGARQRRSGVRLKVSLVVPAEVLADPVARITGRHTRQNHLPVTRAGLVGDQGTGNSAERSAQPGFVFLAHLHAGATRQHCAGDQCGHRSLQRVHIRVSVLFC